MSPITGLLWTSEAIYLNPCVNSSVNRGLFVEALIACIILPSAQNMICFTKWQKVIEFIDMTPHEHLNMYVIYISIYNEKFSESLCLHNVPKLWTEITSLNIFKCLCLQILGFFFKLQRFIENGVTDLYIVQINVWYVVMKN